MSYAGLQYRFPSRYRVIWIAVVALVLICAIVEPHTFSATSLKIETPLVAVLAIASLGQLLVVIVGGFDLSVAAVITFASALLLKLGHGADDRVAIAVIGTLVFCVLAGMISGLLASTGLNALIVTLAMGGVLGAVTLLISNGGVEVLSVNIPKPLTHLAGGYVGKVSNLFFIALALVASVALILRNTRVGRRLVASGANPNAARIAGIRTRAYTVGAYGAAGLLYGIAGVLLAAFVEHPDVNVGSPYLLSTFIVVALGGALLGGGPSSVAGTAAGAVFLTLLNHFLEIKGLSPGDQSLIQGLVLIAAVAAVTAVRAGSIRARFSLGRRRVALPGPVGS
jgi:ribose transport system permease protein